jgi:tetratricopeptide (TPR) repeat protein
MITSYRLDDIESIEGKRTEFYMPGVNNPEEKKGINAVREALNQGLYYLDKERYESAIAEFSKAIEIDPGLSDLYYNRGFAYSKAGKLDQAIADYSKAIQLNPEDSDSYYNRGLAYHSKKDFDRAIADYTESIRITPDIGATYYNRALDYSLKQDFDKAWEDVHKAESLGYTVSAYFLTELKKASRRSR